MAVKYQSYPEYKNTGIEWLETIPKHWQSKPIKTVCIVDNSGHYGNEPGTQDTDLPVATTAQIDKNGYFQLNKMPIRSFTCSEVKKYLCIKGDILVVKSSGSAENIISGKAGYIDTSTPDFIFSNFLLRLSPDIEIVGPKFVYYFITSHITTERIKKMVSTTTYPNLQVGSYISSHIPFPQIKEQTQILNFLDHETTKIDTLIEKQQQLIKLLKEKRQTVISHAVTKGLNPDAPMRDSGVEWLGEVPEHWNLTEIRYIAKQMGGGTPSKDREEYWDGNIPWVSPKDMKVNHIDDSQDKITEQAVNNSSVKFVPKGSVLIVVRGMILQHSVPVALTLKKLTVNQDMKALIPVNTIEGEYLLFLLIGFRDFILDLVDISAHGTKCLRTEIFERLKIAIPNIYEQEEIIAQLRIKLDDIDSLFQKVYLAIDLLKERRTALISAAVTGKIDVRKWQPPEHQTNKKEAT